MKLRNLVLPYLATVMVASSASIIGINFNGSGAGDGAGAQEPGAGSFGATWTDIVGNDLDANDDATGLALNGTTATLDLNASGWWSAGSWTGTDGFNSAIGMMRAYLNDNGVSITLNGMSAWLASESATGYTVTIYTSTDNGTSFKDVTIAGSTVSIASGGNGSWDGTSEDPLGNSNEGLRGSGTSGVITDDNLVIGIPSNSYPARASVAGLVITAVPEPGSTALAVLGLGAILMRRRR